MTELGRMGERRLRPRIGTVFLLTGLVILLLPLGGVVLLRLYESALIRRTEAELIAQAALTAAAWREFLARELDVGPRPEPWGRPVEPRLAQAAAGEGQPLSAQLDLTRDPVLPPPGPGLPPARPADPAALAAGRRIEPILRAAQQVTLAGLRVLDPEGRVVASSGSESGLSLLDREEVRRALGGEVARVLRRRVLDRPLPPLDSASRAARLRVVVALPVREGDRVWGAVLAARTPMSVAQSLFGIRWHLAAGGIGLLAAVAALSAFTSLAVTRPIAELVRRTERVARGEAGAALPLERPGTREIDRLSRALVEMARTLEARAAYITGFAASVSHEFKTPLASMRGTVELLRDHLGKMSAEERARFLGILEEDVARLDRLVRGLVELARADVLRPGEAASDAAAALARARDHFASRGYPVALAPTAGSLPVRVSAEALDAILRHLLENARGHGGRARVSAAAEPQEGRPGVALRIADDGPGISPANLARVFEPFFTTARERGGTGLGLAVVRALVRAHGGTIGVESRPGETVFRVWLPGPLPPPG